MPSLNHFHFLLLPMLAAYAPGQEVSLGQRLRNERPEIEKLLQELRPREALQRVEAFLPPEIPPFRPADLRSQVESHLLLLAVSQSYYLAYRAADASGYWEKALAYLHRARDAGLANTSAVQEPFTKVVTGFLDSAARSRATLERNADLLKQLRAKKDPDEGEMQSLDGAAREEKNIVDSEKWAKAFQDYLGAAKADSTRYDALAAAQEKRIKDQEVQIVEYRAGKGDKSKWVEAIISNPSTYAAYTEKQDLVGFLYRLNVLDPENKKVLHQIDVVLGKSQPPQTKKPKAGHGKPGS